MARLTIEDCWWTDPRREMLGELVGGMALADGYAIRMWRLAQEHWGRGRQLIPHEIFDTLQAAAKLIQAGLATVQAEGIYVRGSSQYVDWLNEKRDAGRAGGRVSAQRPRNAKGQLEKKPKQNPSSAQAEPKHDQPSGFGFGSVLGEIKHFAAQNGDVAPRPPDKCNPVADWVNAYHKKYGVRYAFQKKDFGFLKNAGEVHGERCADLFACYLAIDEPLYMNAKHPLSLFFRDLQKISVAAHTQVNPANVADQVMNRFFEGQKLLGDK